MTRLRKDGSIEVIDPLKRLLKPKTPMKKPTTTQKEVTAHSSKISRSWSNLNSHQGWIEGTVATRYGFVTVYSQGDPMNFNWTDMQFIWGGHHHTHSIKARFTKKGLARLAHKFVRSIVNA